MEGKVVTEVGIGVGVGVGVGVCSGDSCGSLE